ncbi:MAG: VOC family protein [Euryarchaeota archaeon]|nr:VOC family protein [Euryarchaeota archaeon]MDE2046119.1 VOC family protein [Thermoplasmata archaeon]
MVGKLKLKPYSVAVVVKDRKRSLRWYHEKLGLDILADHEHWAVVGSKKQGVALHLCAVREFDPRGRLEKGNTGILLRTDRDIERTYRELRKRGVKFSLPPTKEDWGWACTLVDPDGNEIRLAPSW